MKTLTIYTEYLDSQYEHGTIEVNDIDMNETRLEVNFNFTIERGEEENFKKELEKLMQKYVL